ncbi:hypothetical protein O1611_g3919 [Lasiodiplodia mahajangana]|uniref:Uncharacterized protein n=1 Tax=Lasiodiplodia mahajangana TaxID=1108764 RepID=A0ACC2JR91_9PEZI|nr:hypothetical protein O1611_g3919 [Lasiodiplodia mahajangana]
MRARPTVPHFPTQRAQSERRGNYCEPTSPRPWLADGLIACLDTAVPWSAQAPERAPRQSRIEAWLRSVCPDTRSTSCPPVFDLTETRYTRPLFRSIREMAGGSPQSEADSNADSMTASSDLSKRAAHFSYRNTLTRNNIHLDVFGFHIPPDVKTFLDTTILKRREPPLGDDAVSRVINMLEEISESGETDVQQLFHTEMFPYRRRGIKVETDTTWSSTPLPNEPEENSNLVTPKPDYSIGYSVADWSSAQWNVLNSAEAREYTQPARNALLPFMIVEAKSEATGGTIFVAENQAAGAGAHCVNSLLWLYNKASITDTVDRTNKVAFSITLCQRQAHIYVHWYSEDDGRFYMSLVEAYWMWKPNDIRACHDAVKNIVDHALGARRDAIKRALDVISPHYDMLRSRKRKNRDADDDAEGLIMNRVPKSAGIN